MKIGILGPKGTYSEQALKLYQKKQSCTPYFFQTLEETTASLDDMDKIIIPLENTLEGYIGQMLDFLIHKDVFIEEEIYVHVQFSCISYLEMSQVSHMFVQFAAKGQCQTFIKSYKNRKLTLTSSNTQSLNLFLNGKKTDAAIVPTHLVPHDVLSVPVTDTLENYTRFVVVSPQKNIRKHTNYKVSLAVIPKDDRPGLLYDILGVFKSLQINLTSIISRPQKNQMGNYYFYIEFDMFNHTSMQIQTLIHSVKSSYHIKILGIYPHQL